MGFLDRLVKGVVGDVMGDVVDKLTEGVSATVKEKLGEVFPDMPSYREAEKTENTEKHAVESGTAERTVVQTKTTVKPTKSMESRRISPEEIRVSNTLSEVLASEYAEYEIKKEISPAEIGGIEPFKNYTYGIYKEGSPAVLIMVTDHNKANRFFRGAKTAAENANIPFVNFFSHFPNTPEYVSNRLRQYL